MTVLLRAVLVVVDGSEIAFPDVQPMITGNDRVIVPLRTVFEKLGARVAWRETVNAVTVDKGTMHIELGIGDRTVTVNYETKRTDQGVKMVRGRLMVPIRFISETLGARVEWDRDTRTVHIWSAAGTPVR